jgi:hypothetical protein
MTDIDLDHLEDRTYRDSFADGLIDLYLGASVAWIGACWLWIEPLATFATILPAALLPLLIPLRARIIERRIGHVRWTAPRRRWERDQMVALLGLGIGFLLLVAAIGTYLVAADLEALRPVSLAAGIPAALITIPVAVVAISTRIRRLWGYVAVLVATTVTTVLVDGNPGWPLLAAGIVAAVTGAVLFARFRRAYPVREPW